MEVNKILSADLLDIIFEGRNKEYGAYYLRKTYNERVKRALIITASIAGMILLISFLNQTLGDKGDSKVKINEMTLQDVKQEEKEPPPPP
ncbi:MAG: energy transducer TonB, partial [Bacteroidota bacterium]